MIEQFLASYAAYADDRKSGAYSDLDRARDFKAVFGTPQGQKVLMQLMVWAKMIMPTGVLDDEALRAAEGQRTMVFNIFNELTAEPRPDTKTVNRRI